jgi:DNA modification methylase
MIELIHGDCLEKMKGIPDKSIDFVLTDPPYLHIKGGNKGWVGEKYLFEGKESFNETFINKKMSDFGELNICSFLDSIKTKMQKMNCIVFCSELQLQYYFKWINKNKYKYNLLVWDNGNRVIMNIRHQRRFELVIPHPFVIPVPYDCRDRVFFF